MSNSNSKLAPLSPWAYFWLQILFSIPVIGFIFLIIYSISSANINRRNFARSYFCFIIIVGIILGILIATGALTSVLEFFQK